jgi:hypothetical protein
LTKEAIPFTKNIIAMSNGVKDNLPILVPLKFLSINGFIKLANAGSHSATTIIATNAMQKDL